MNLLFDVGGTHTRLALSSNGKTFDKVAHFKTDISNLGVAKLLEEMDTFVEGQDISVVAGGMPGRADTTGKWIHLPNMPGWVGASLQQEITSKFGCPVYIENDAAVVGLGEATHGSGRGYSIVVYLTVSTGFNGARIVNRMVDANAHGFELGEMLMTDKDGSLVSLESLVGGAAIGRRYGRPASMVKDPSVWNQEARYLALGLFNTLLFWSPDAVVYGGPMMRDVHVDMILGELKRLPKVYEELPPIALSKLGDDGGLYGALELSKAIGK